MASLKDTSKTDSSKKTDVSKKESSKDSDASKKESSKESDLSKKESVDSKKELETFEDKKFFIVHKGRNITFELRKKGLMYVDLNDTKEYDDVSTDEDEDEDSQSYSDSCSDTESSYSTDLSAAEYEVLDEDGNEIINGFTSMMLYHTYDRNLFNNRKVLLAIRETVGKFLEETFGVDIKICWGDEDKQGKRFYNFDIFQKEVNEAKVPEIKKHPLVTTVLEEFLSPLIEELNKEHERDRDRKKDKEPKKLEDKRHRK